MIPAEMTPLLRLMERLSSQLKARDCDDIIEALAFYRAQVRNDFTARVVCRQVVDRCRPKAWGDRFVTDMDHAEWLLLLRELRSTAERALQRLETRSARD